jgi:hypothetical protein
VRGPDVEPLHLADARLVRAERDAAGRLRVERQQQAAAGRRVLAWKLSELTLEVLEAEVDAERVRVLLEEPANDGHMLPAVPGDDLHGHFKP